MGRTKWMDVAAAAAAGITGAAAVTGYCTPQDRADGWH